jgi:hypothetical protein
MPLYMNPALTKTISPPLKKRMQGKTCFNFKADPEPDIVLELTRNRGRSQAMGREDVALKSADG